MKFRREVGEKGQVVIPKDIREYLGLKPRSKVMFEIENSEVKIRPEQSPEEFLEDFLNVPKIKRKLSGKEIKKILEEEYELP